MNTLDKFEIAKDITLSAITNKLIEPLAMNDKMTYAEANKKLADKIADFYNELVLMLKVP